MRAQLSQQDLALIRVGMPASVTPVGLDQSFAGSVWQVAPVIDPQSRQGEVRIAIPYDPAIRPGGFAEARIRAGATTAPLLPQSAVLSDEKGNYVYVINGKNEVERRAIKIGNGRRQRRDHRRGPDGPGSGRAVGRPVPQPGPEGRAEAPGRTLITERLKPMNFRNISSWCIRNPVPPIVLFIALMMAGIVVVQRDGRQQQPGHRFPGGQIVIVQPGAAPTEMENQVTQKVEAAVRGVTGVDEINSSVREGNSNTFVQFEIGTTTDRAVNDVRDAIAQIRGDLPDGILEPQIERVDIAGDPIMFVAAETTDMTPRATELVHRQ